MLMTMGKVSEFNLNEDDWKTYSTVRFFFKQRISDESLRKAI